MTIKDLVNLYFKQYKEIDIKGEMVEGVPGKEKTYTKEEFNKVWEGWMDKEVISIIFETHSTFHSMYEPLTLGKKFDKPKLYFCYIN